MKFIYLAVLAIVFSYACHRKISAAADNSINNTSLNNPGRTAYLDTRGNPMLLGAHPAEDLEQPPYGDWFNRNYADYTIDSATTILLRPLVKDKTFELFMGTWCGDSKREIPRMLKILRYAGVKPAQFKLVMLDTHDSVYKQSPAHEEKGKDIHRVPELLVYDAHHREMNRIIESPAVSLEKDLLHIMQGDAYISAYPGAGLLIRRLKESPAASLAADKEKLIAELKPVVRNERDLTSLAWEWMRKSRPAEDREKALLALQVNTALYPNAPLTYDLLADLNVQLNHKEAAKKLYAKVLELQPENTKTKEKLAKLETEGK